MEVEIENKTQPNWLHLPTDLTANILQRLGAVEILTSASQVCPLWWKICKDPLMWRIIHISNVRNSPYDKHVLENICYNAVQRSSNHLEEIDIEYFGTDYLLKCIANNGSHLRCMRLANCRKISDEEFRKAVKKLPQLEEVDISNCDLCVKSIETLGLCCSRLTSFKFERLHFVCCNSVFAIAETMPGLCHLDLIGHEVDNDGLLAILDKCPLLKSLDLRGCGFLELNDSLVKRCIDQINDLQLPGPDDDDLFVSDDFY